MAFPYSGGVSGLARALAGTDAFASPIARALSIASLALYLGLVGVGVATHEFWRDEVRALSIALDAPSVPALFRALHGEGHPALWYLLLRGAHALLPVREVLPALGILCGVPGALFFYVRAPFPLWVRIGFLFGLLPLFEYTVMCRNYGVSMTLIFLIAALYPRRRDRPLGLGLLLFALANTNAYATIAALGLALPLALEAWPRRRPERDATQPPSTWQPPGLAIVGAALAAWTAAPHASGELASLTSGLAQGALRGLLAVPRLSLASWIGAPLAINAAVLVVVFGALLRRPPLAAAFAGTSVASAVFASAVYGGNLRHLGVLYAFSLALLWIAWESEPTAGPRLARVAAAGRRALLVAVLPFMLLGQGHRGAALVLTDFRGAMSSAPRLAELLASDAAFRGAAIVAEPAYLLEALPYYADNPLYFPRERRFGRATKLAMHPGELALGELLAAGRRLARESDRPVLFAVGRELPFDGEAGAIEFPFGWILRWTAEELDSFRAATEPVADLYGTPFGENFSIHRLRE